MNRRAEMVYQVRPGAGGTFEDLVAELAEAAWGSLEPDGLRESARWLKLQSDLLDVFKNRLRLHPGCGLQTECLSNGAGGPVVSGATYLLTLRGGLLGFVKGLGALAWRRLRDGPSRRRELRCRLQETLHRGLLPYLLFNETCSACRVPFETAGRRMPASRPPAA